MDYYNKITILHKYYKLHLNKKNLKDANKTLNQMKNLHGKVVETLLSLKDSHDENKLELLSDIEMINYKIIQIINSCNNKNLKEEDIQYDEIDEVEESKNISEEVTEKTKINKKLNSLVLFYAEWCGHCKNFMPTWDALTKLIPKDIINMVKISCVQKEKECSAIKDIRGYPTIIFVDMKASKTVVFSGSRDPQTIIEFINECMGSEVLKLA